VAQAKAIVAELKKYDKALYDKPRWLVLNKLDMVPAEEREARVKDFVKRFKLQGAGVRDLRAHARRLRGPGQGRVPARARAHRSQEQPPGSRPALRRGPGDNPDMSGEEAEGLGHEHRDCARRARIVVKVGSSLVTNDGRGLDEGAIGEWCRQLARWRATAARSSWCPAAPSPKA
jgi:hypothetical protein